ncbi:MAG: redoxin family protein [Thermoguttaceae bacterium]|nr:redoxin family protein [Thermoguttaceae bacterium]MDW8079199.1 redoxin family protein [Thermoguttaceae bacterium]
MRYFGDRKMARFEPTSQRAILTGTIPYPLAAFLFTGGTALLAIILLIAPGCARRQQGSEAPTVSAVQKPAEGPPKAVKVPPAGETKPPAPEAVPPAPPAEPPKEDALELLRKVIAAYRAAEGYQDKGTIQVRAEVDGQPRLLMQGDYQFYFARPNRFRLQCYQGLVVCDGENFYGMTAALPQQVLRRPAPPELSISAIYEDFELATGLADGPTRPAFWVPIQLLLFAAKDPLKTLLHQSKPPRFLQPQKLDQAFCDRIAIERPEGAIVLWIDRADLVIKQVEFPAAPLAANFPPDRVRNLEIVADLSTATLRPPSDSQPFTFRVPENTEVVEVIQPPAIRWLGKQLPDFKVVTIEGKPLTAQDLRGKVAVIEFWATWCGNCRESLPLLEQVYQLHKDLESVQFWAISIDEAERSDLELENVFNSLQVTIPIARDPGASLAKAMGIAGIPTLVVTNAQGVIEYFETGVRPDLGEQLRLRLERLLAGQSTYQELLDRYQRDFEIFRKLSQNCIAEDLYVFPPPPAQVTTGPQIAPRQEPKAHRLEELWTTQEIPEPGNILVVSGDPGQPPRIFVLSAGRDVFELAVDGKIVGKANVSSRPDKPIRFLRHTRDKDGRSLFAGWVSPGLEVTVFDANWESRLVFPPNAEENPHTGIADAVFADLDGDGTTELLVGYWNVVGVQYVSLEGKRLWSNRSVTDAVRVVVYEDRGAQVREVFCIDTRGGIGGAIARLDAQGRRVGEISLRQHVFVWLQGADLDKDGKTELCALRLSDAQELEAVGVSREGEILWQYPVPFGIHPLPIEPVTYGPVGGRPTDQWVIAAADGSIHFLDPDGKPVDSFAAGSQLAGIALADLGSGPVLLLSTPERLTAWRIVPK